MNSPPWANQHYYQPCPNAYIPPPVYSENAYIDLRIYIPAPYISRYASAKYPNLNPILAADTMLLHFDVKKTPQSQIPVPTYYSYRHVPAMVHRASHVRLISKAFPWTIDIIPDAQAPVTCQAVWKALYDALQEPLVDSEWGLIVGVKRLRETVEKAVKKRIEDGGMGEDKKRIDFLGDVTLFKGLERDEEFEKVRLLPGEKPCPETWVVKLAS
ncbi:hypothetical protein Hypma_002544 [Hypsizygus marmoreus]|uniref:DUF6699 domain-containing protein n=1 Tax=Hypsizygus marmoreus TaxID=39966 RepID=A0A369J4E6_HYPMA|nr:hypothetical protein Hypma_002544 [Hypsizygus marmoreus]